MGKLPELKEEDRKIIDHMTHMIVRKMLREPMIRLNEYAGTDKESAGKKAVANLFSLDVRKENFIEE